MSDKKEEKQTPKDHHHHQNPLFSPFDFDQQTTTTTPTTNPSTTTKRPRYLTTTATAAATSPDTSSSPSAQELTKHHQQPLRKGKLVSPIWKPHEMLWLARAWRAQHQHSASGPASSGDGDGSGGPGPTGSGPGGRGKTRAEKDKEVAEFLMREGVNRDAKTAGTKWDNMLGEFRKVYEWERGGEKEKVECGNLGNLGGGNLGGKSYFRLSPYERKLHRLPASFDEQVFEELAQFMGPKMRPSSSSINVSNIFYRQPPRHGGDFGGKALPMPMPMPMPMPPLLTPTTGPGLGLGFRDDDFPLSSMLSGRTRQIEQYTTPRNTTSRHHHNPNPMLAPPPGYDPYPHPHPHPHPILDLSTRPEMRRVGRVRMTWDESVSLWGSDQHQHQEGGGSSNRGRVKVEGGSSLFNAEELVYFDEAMVASTLEAFEDGPLKGFSVDSFVPGQHLKVFGRRKSSNPSLHHHHFGASSSSIAPTPTNAGEFQDPTEYHLSCLRTLPSTLPTLMELSWYIQEPPPEEFRLPLRSDIYRDLPQGKDLFFTPSNNPLLDCKSFTIDVLSSLIRSYPSIISTTSSTRESYIGLWDDCINRVVSRFCPFEMVFIRKSDNNYFKSNKSRLLHDTSCMWPNVTGLVKNLCLWRGEEVDRVRDYDPSSTITSKISWTYNDLPYVLGYYAIGHNVTFCALSPLSSSEMIRTDLYTVDLSDPSERLKSIIPCWRIGILLASLAERCTTTTTTKGGDCESDFAQQEVIGDDGDIIIELTPSTMTRVYSNKKKWQKIKEIYDMLDQRIPHGEHLIYNNEIELSLVFKPRGVKSKPKNIEELVLALKQVTKALVALHDLSFMHRDLSWDKVLLRSRSTSTSRSRSRSSNQHEDEDEDLDENEENSNSNSKEWFVSGFEEAVGAPQINPRVITATGSGPHAPEMARGVHGVKVDVWGVGYLVKTSGVKVTKSEEGGVVGLKIRELEEKCMEQNPEERPTAADCYHHLLQIQSSLSSTVTNTNTN